MENVKISSPREALEASRERPGIGLPVEERRSSSLARDDRPPTHADRSYPTAGAHQASAVHFGPAPGGEARQEQSSRLDRAAALVRDLPCPGRDPL